VKLFQSFVTSGSWTDAEMAQFFLIHGV